MLEKTTIESLPPSSSSSSDSGNIAGESYIGSFISLISKYEIRYEGVLYHLNLKDATLGLKNVRSCGTEGRKKDGPQIPPSDKVYDYILFRGSDIKDLQVKYPPSTTSAPAVAGDPTIIQSHFPMGPLSSSQSASLGGKNLTASAQWMDTPALSSKPFSAAQLAGVPLNFSPASAGVPEASSPQLGPNRPVSSPITMLNQPVSLDVSSSPIMGVVSASKCVTPASAPVSNSLYPNFSPFAPPQRSTSGISSTSSMNPHLKAHEAYITANSSTSLSYSPSPLSSHPTSPQNVCRTISDPASSCPVQQMPYQLSVVPSDLSPLLPPPSRLPPDQFLQYRQHALVSAQTLVTGQDTGAVLRPALSDSLPRSPMPLSQAQLLPLPGSLQQSQYLPGMQFSEEFDFEAMNEKFKKDEVWGYLGKTKLMDKTDTGNLNAAEPSVVDATKPAYKKDDFFDTISCNSLNRGARDGQNRFYDRTQQDTQTFGNYQRGLQPGDGGYVAGHANYRHAYNPGAGYDHNGGRGRGWNTYF